MEFSLLEDQDAKLNKRLDWWNRPQGRARAAVQIHPKTDDCDKIKN